MRAVLRLTSRAACRVGSSRCAAPSNLPGVREPVTPGQTGWYVDDPENLESVVTALRGVVADRPRLAAMKRTCRAVAVERYSVRAMCESYWNVFTHLVEARA